MKFALQSLRTMENFSLYDNLHQFSRFSFVGLGSDLSVGFVSNNQMQGTSSFLKIYKNRRLPS